MVRTNIAALQEMRGSLSVIAVAACLFTACTSGERQRLQLEELERMNRADSVMLNDSLARDLADWFDRHGTRNEQLRAYYMLGRTYADRGEVPQALEAYHDAIDRADTTAQDCNYYTLCRVYAQMSDILYYQNLFEDNLRCLKLSVRYALKANDSITAVNSYAHQLGAYDRYQMTDSIISISEATYRKFCQMGMANIASQYCALAIDAYARKKMYDKARFYMEVYEKESGYFDTLGNIERGREAYYDIKGRYYLSANELDSAEYFFRKELRDGVDYNNQNMASLGLAQVYQQKRIPDSVAKYAVYGYAMKDSIVIHKQTAEALRIQAMYDYTRSERIANQKSREADRLWFSLLFIVAVLSILSLVFAIVYQRHQSEKRLLEEKIRILKDYTVNERLYNSRVARRFRQLLNDNPYQQPALDDWKELRLLLSAELPAFHDCLNSDGRMLSDFEYDVCMLIKIQISSSGIAKLKQCTPAHVTKTRKAIYQKLFNKKGRANELDEYILSLS